MPLIRPATPTDADAIRAVMDAAFGQPDEGQIVDRLRNAGAIPLALVAEEDDAILGALIFSPVTVDERPTRLVGLAPMAVRPDRQRDGIGSALVRDGLDRLAAEGVDGVVVLGHPDYYPRFGFRPASAFGLRCIYPVPNEVFMAMPLCPGGLDGTTGLVRYHAALG